MPSGPSRRRWLRWVIAGVGTLVVLAVAVPFVYIHFIEGPAPAPLSLVAGKANGARVSQSSVAGTWTIASGSEAGYRVQEVLAGQNNTAVGRTDSVTGTLQLTGSRVSGATFTVDLRTVHSDESARDAQFNGRIMNTVTYPDATFVLTRPIELGTLPREGQVVHLDAVGTLAMHGVTRRVTAALEATYTGSAIDISGSIPVLFADWDIANPSFAGFVTTANHGSVEFLLLTHKS
jgi:polyisoprenoid-binding protein YceI